MSDEDLYKILGVERNATQEQIREAFKNKAKISHPDAVKEDSEKKRMEEEFKRVSNAYNILSNADRRRDYDRKCSGRGTGAQWARTATNSPFGGSTFHVYSEGSFGGNFNFDMFEAFNRAYRHRASQPPGIVECRLQVDILDFHRKSSFKSSPVPVFSSCTECGGTGVQFTTGCQLCGGYGAVRFPKVYTVERGNRGGSRYFFKLQGEGNFDPRTRMTGDVYIVVDPVGNEIFTPIKDSLDVNVNSCIPMHTAFFGGKAEVPTLDGMAVMTVPPGTVSGATFRMPRMGLLSDNRGSRGDQIVTVKVAAPTFPSEECVTLLKNILEGAKYPDADSYAKKVETVMGRPKE